MELFIQSEIDRINGFSAFVDADYALIMDSPLSAQIDYPKKDNKTIHQMIDFKEILLKKNRVMFDFNDLPFGNGSFDLIVAPHLFELAPHPSLTLAHLRSTLDDGGSMIITGFNALNPLAKRTSREYLGGDAAQPITPNTAKKRLSECGLRIIAAQYYYYEWWIPAQSSDRMRQKAHWVSERWFARFALGFIIHCHKNSNPNNPWQKLVSPLRNAMSPRVDIEY